MREVVSAVEAVLGRPVRMEDLGERPGDVPALYANSQRLRTATGWQPEVGLEEGLRRTVEWFSTHPELV